MFKCFECGHLFERGEEKRYTEAHGESYLACPICGGAYEETEQCTRCGSHHHEDHLWNGLCIDCLGELMTLKNMQAYLEENNLEQDFYIEEFYESSVHFVSKELIDLAHGGFLQAVQLDRLSGGDGEKYVEQMRKFIVDDHFGLYDFAEWWNKKEEKKNG